MENDFEIFAVPAEWREDAEQSSLVKTMRDFREMVREITRGKRLLVLVGQKKALGIAVRNDRPQRRYSGCSPAYCNRSSQVSPLKWSMVERASIACGLGIKST